MRLLPLRKCSNRAHTPIVSEKQRRLFGAAASGASYAPKSLSKFEAKRHLKEVKGKKLPLRVKKHKKKIHKSLIKIGEIIL